MVSVAEVAVVALMIDVAFAAAAVPAVVMSEVALAEMENVSQTS